MQLGAQGFWDWVQQLPVNWSFHLQSISGTVRQGPAEPPVWMTTPQAWWGADWTLPATFWLLLAAFS